MNLTGNTILITGGATGIGRALAEAFYARGNTVIIAGRKQSKLDEVTAAHPGIQARTLDITDADTLPEVVATLLQDFPALNVVIHSAGIMRAEDLRSGDLTDAEETIATNLLGVLRLNAALLAHLINQPQAAVLTISSGLAFMPMAMTPSYNASKAAIHSYTQSLRYQLRATPVQVIELVPPAVQTELMGPDQATNPNYLPLSEFTAETMHLLESEPEAEEILVERVKPLRYAERSGGFDVFFNQFNDAVSGGH